MTPTQPPSGGRGGVHDSDEPVSELVQRASQQLTELVRGEMQLAQAEMKEKAGATARAGACSVAQEWSAS